MRWYSLRLRLWTVIATFMTAFSFQSFAGGGWINQPGTLYAKIGLTTLSTNAFHGPDGSLITTADFTTQTLQFYSEYGILEDLSAVFDIPFLKRSKYITSRAVTGFGDVGIEFKYGLMSAEIPVAVGVRFELPTGDKNAFGRNLSNPDAIIYLPTGDGEFNVWARAYASHSFHPFPVFVTLDAGYNFRTQNLTDQYQVGFQLGYKPVEGLWLFGNVRRLALVGQANTQLIFNAIGVGEGVEYSSYGMGISYGFLPHLSISLDAASAFGPVKNIYSGTNVGFGIAVDY